MEELLNQISTELSRSDHDPMWISVKPRPCLRTNETSTENHQTLQLHGNGRTMNVYYPFLKGIYGPADIPTIFQEKKDRIFGHQTPLWLDDIFVLTRGTKRNTPGNYIRYSPSWKTKDTKQAKNQNLTKKIWLRPNKEKRTQ